MLFLCVQISDMLSVSSMTVYGRLFDSELQIVVQTELLALGQMMVWGGGAKVNGFLCHTWKSLICYP